jgi:hypothetical protein
MSPELLHPQQFGARDGRPTKESDCYALGMVIYEVLSGQVPFSRYEELYVLGRVINGERPGRPLGIKGVWFTDDLWATMELCWSSQPKDRPAIEVVLKRLITVSATWQPPPPNVGCDLDIFRHGLKQFFPIQVDHSEVSLDVDAPTSASYEPTVIQHPPQSDDTQPTSHHTRDVYMAGPNHPCLIVLPTQVTARRGL